MPRYRFGPPSSSRPCSTAIADPASPEIGERRSQPGRERSEPEARRARRAAGRRPARHDHARRRCAAVPSRLCTGSAAAPRSIYRPCGSSWPVGGAILGSAGPVASGLRASWPRARSGSGSGSLEAGADRVARPFARIGSDEWRRIGSPARSASGRMAAGSIRARAGTRARRGSSRCNEAAARFLVPYQSSDRIARAVPLPSPRLAILGGGRPSLGRRLAAHEEGPRSRAGARARAIVPGSNRASTRFGSARRPPAPDWPARRPPCPVHPPGSTRSDAAFPIAVTPPGLSVL